MERKTWFQRRFTRSRKPLSARKMTRRYTGSSKVPESGVCNPEALGDPQTRDKASAIVTLTAYPQARGQGHGTGRHLSWATLCGGSASVWERSEVRERREQTQKAELALWESRCNKASSAGDQSGRETTLRRDHASSIRGTSRVQTSATSDLQKSNQRSEARNILKTLRENLTLKWEFYT